MQIKISLPQCDVISRKMVTDECLGIEVTIHSCKLMIKTSVMRVEFGTPDANLHKQRLTSTVATQNYYFDIWSLHVLGYSF
jgi:hypothetical protein